MITQRCKPLDIWQHQMQSLLEEWWTPLTLARQKDEKSLLKILGNPVYNEQLWVILKRLIHHEHPSPPLQPPSALSADRPRGIVCPPKISSIWVFHLRKNYAFLVFSKPQKKHNPGLDHSLHLQIMVSSGGDALPSLSSLFNIATTFHTTSLLRITNIIISSVHILYS